MHFGTPASSLPCTSHWNSSRQGYSCSNITASFPGLPTVTYSLFGRSFFAWSKWPRNKTTRSPPTAQGTLSCASILIYIHTALFQVHIYTVSFPLHIYTVLSQYISHFYYIFTLPHSQYTHIYTASFMLHIPHSQYTSNHLTHATHTSFPVYTSTLPHSCYTYLIHITHASSYTLPHSQYTSSCMHCIIHATHTSFPVHI